MKMQFFIPSEEVTKRLNNISNINNFINEAILKYFEMDSSTIRQASLELDIIKVLQKLGYQKPTTIEAPVPVTQTVEQKLPEPQATAELASNDAEAKINKDTYDLMKAISSDW